MFILAKAVKMQTQKKVSVWSDGLWLNEQSCHSDLIPSLFSNEYEV